ncbi:MAG: DNA mismatch repair endonuclease MutL [Bacteroidales bacterium]|nr:DNA mismatch repair endonuclease MutL [Bacteroidales bacterium]
MSDVIQVLPDSVANQIAAGEVIQRPASLIKELVENSIDAGATRIDVVVVEAGKALVQVIDNGKGMSEMDARLAFERHATSKIRKADDLFSLRTMGFRGEALASIAAVAQVELRTRMESDELGTCIRINGSRFESQESVSCPKGSNFCVKNLFYNIPARRKFLKSNATELNNMLTEFERIVLVNPAVSFSIKHNGLELMNLPAAGLKQRILAVFGKKLNEELLPIEANTSLVHVSGYVGVPESSRKKGARQFFFVNGRFMRHPYFHKAVMESFNRLVPEGEQISYFIAFQVDPATIDVNIHPTKTEIKFENEQAIWQILEAAIKEALGRFNEVPSIDFDTEGKPEIPIFDSPNRMGFSMPKVDYNPSYNPFHPQATAKKDVVGWDSVYAGLERSSEDVPDSKPEPMFAVPDELAAPNEFLQYKGRLIITSVRSGLMLIDQHKAHIRVLYDRYLAQMAARKTVSQGILFPEVVQLSASECAVMPDVMDDLGFLGFDLSNLGGGSYSINGIPAGIDGLNPVRLVHDIVSAAVETNGCAKDGLHESLALSLARAAAIVHGQVLSQQEMSHLVADLLGSSSPEYTPDGERVLTILPDASLL